MNPKKNQQSPTKQPFQKKLFLNSSNQKKIPQNKKQQIYQNPTTIKTNNI